MALPLQQRPTRQHRVVAPRPLTKVTKGVTPAQMRAELRVVPLRRRTARRITAVAATVFVMMAGAAAFQAQIARRQIELGDLDARLAEAADVYDTLRRQRAELRSPGRLAQEATALGMAPGSRNEFMAVTPDAVAVVLQSGGALAESTPLSELSELERVAAVKAALESQP